MFVNFKLVVGAFGVLSMLAGSGVGWFPSSDSHEAVLNKRTKLLLYLYLVLPLVEDCVYSFSTSSSVDNSKNCQLMPLGM